MSNDDSDTEYNIYVASDSDVNIGEDVNLSDMLPVTGGISMGSTVTPG